jgi:septal ring factor EnvC (AmiA/AmiB activator)
MKKLGKIAPVVVIIACLGSGYFAFKISTQKKDMQDQIAGLSSEKQRLETELASTKKDLSTTQTALAKTSEDLTTATNNLHIAQAELTAKTQEADTLKAQLETSAKELEQAKTESEAARTTLAQIQDALTKSGVGDIQSLDQLSATIAAQTEENKILAKQLLAMKEQIEILTTTPEGTRGHVAAVQDSWGFVVLDIGRDQRVSSNAQFVVYRDAKMIGKVQVQSVGQNTSVAEILPEFQRSGLRVGDVVIH